ncbi:MAG: exodeoxyribonuclease VII large subunit [Mongoliitalea sp.]
MQEAISLVTLNKIIRDTLDTQLEPSYWVIAEIGELKAGPNGHAYLDLLEKEGNQTLAKIRGTIWSYSYRTVASKFQQATGQRLQASMKILASVTVTFHEVYGISLNIKDIDPAYTLGERAKLRQAIIDRLTREGLMEQNKQLSLPIVPQRIAVISSPHAAGYEDFINQLQHNSYGYRIHTTLFPSVMQGAEAGNSIRAAVNLAIATANFEAIVLIRGGGAALDLECFDDYALAKTLAESPIPVLTGIGHERDETVADMVAHTKLKTPTAVAAFLLDGFLEFEENLLVLHKRMERTVFLHLQHQGKLLDQHELRIQNHSRQEIKRSQQQLQQLQHSLKLWTGQALKIQSLHIRELHTAVQKSWKRLVEGKQQHLEQIAKDIFRLDPQEHFKRGYTRTEINGTPLQQQTPAAGDSMVTYTGKQRIESIIQQINTDEPTGTKL